MKLAFIFDVRFIKYKESYYSINLSEEFWNTRYLRLFDEIIVIGRFSETNANPEGKMLKSNSENVIFKCIPDEAPIRRIFNWKKESRFITNQIRDCDAVICRGWWGVDESIKQGKKYLIEVVSCYWDAYWNHGIVGKLVAPFEFYNMRKRVKKAPYVIYVTQQFLQGRYPTDGKYTNISNVMLPDITDNSIAEKRVNKISNLSNTIIIGTAAAIDVRYKGQEFVIKALKILAKRGYINIKYQMIGSGNSNYLKSIAEKEGVSKSVEFCGSLPHDEVIAWLDSIDIYIQPSLQEGLPRSVIEAMSRGLPCIGSRTGGIPELLEKEWICSRKKMDQDIAEKIQTMLDDHSLMIRCSKQNYERAKQYDRELLNNRRYSFLQSFIAEE